jgi:predicted alpha/beta hydrolase family esterase
MKTKKQIVIIHGGTTFKNYRSYLNFLKNQKITIESLKRKKDWKGYLEKILGKEYEVLLPTMPNKLNAKYKEWEIFFKKVSRLLKDNVILIGHSLGGIFLAKYLSKNKIKVKIKSVILVSAPFKERNGLLRDFSLPKSINNFINQAEKIYILHSKDDKIVPVTHSLKYKEIIPKAKILIFKNKGHFNVEKFPELIKIIKSL